MCDFLSVFSCLAHLTLQNVNKDYVIFSYFGNFVTKSDQKLKTKNGMNETKDVTSQFIWLHKAFCPIVICLCQKLFLFLSQEVPETPKNFVMVSHSSRQANLSWGLPYDGQSPLLAFHLEFQRPVGKFLMSYAPSRGCTITFFFFLIQIPFNSFQNLNSYVRNYFNELKNY